MEWTSVKAYPPSILDQLQSDLPEHIGAPARRALISTGIWRLEQLTALREAELLAMHGVGPKAIRLLGEALESRGLGFRE